MPPLGDKSFKHVSTKGRRGSKDDEEQITRSRSRQEENHRLLSPLDTVVWARSDGILVAVGHAGELEEHVCELKDTAIRQLRA